MNITQPKYDVKQRFWVARARKEYNIETVIFDDKEYQREELFWEPYVKEKEVRSIEITIAYNGNVNTIYRCCDVGDQSKFFAMLGTYHESDIKYMNREEAYEAAKEMARVKNEQEYFEKTTLKD